MEESKETLKEGNGESEKAGLKLSIQKMNIMVSGPITSRQLDGRNNENSDKLYFLGLKKSLQIVTSAMKLKNPCSLEEKLT